MWEIPLSFFRTAVCGSHVRATVRETGTVLLLKVPTAMLCQTLSKTRSVGDVKHLVLSMSRTKTLPDRTSVICIRVSVTVMGAGNVPRN